MTLLVALGFPTPVKFWPVLASRVTSAKKRSTTLSGTTTLRGSTEADAFTEPLAGDEDCPCAASERASITAINPAANRVSLDPFCMCSSLDSLRSYIDDLPEDQFDSHRFFDLRSQTALLKYSAATAGWADNGRFQFHKSRQLFIHTHNKAPRFPRDVHQQSRLFARGNPRLSANDPTRSSGGAIAASASRFSAKLCLATSVLVGSHTRSLQYAPGRHPRAQACCDHVHGHGRLQRSHATQRGART